MKTSTCTLLLCLLSIANATFSQNYIGIRPSIDSIFDELDQQYIPTGILIDKTSQTYDLNKYDGVDDTISSFGRLKGAYRMLELSSFVKSGFTARESINEEVIEHADNGVIPFYILNYNYNRIKDYAIDSNLLDTTSNKLIDVTGRLESPYLQKKLFMSCPTSLVSYGSNAKFIFNEDFYFSNDAATISLIEVDFGDGNGFTTVEFVDTVVITYGNLDEHIISLRLTTSSGSFESFASFKMGDICPDDYPHDVVAGVNDYDSYPEDSEDLDDIGHARYTLTYGYTGAVKHTTIKKPLIFIPGLDNGYQNPPDDGSACKYGTMGWVDIITGEMHDLENGEIDEWSPEFDHSAAFFEELWDQGYDVFYLDFKKGDDYMQRNALVLVSLINYINSAKTSEEEIVIIGGSMGGQITRYALSYMEKNDLHHCTLLYISFDSGGKVLKFR